MGTGMRACRDDTERRRRVLPATVRMGWQTKSHGKCATRTAEAEAATAAAAAYDRGTLS